ASRHQQKMGGVIDELGVRRVRLLEPGEFVGEMMIVCPAGSVPSGIRHESTVKQVEAAQIFDVEPSGEIVQQFDRCKLMKAESDVAAVAEVDFAAVPDMILFQPPDIRDRVDKGRRRAANR